MLMVLNLHSFWGYDHGSGFLQIFDFYRETTSICAVNVFILISGYFGIKWKFKSFYNLIFQVMFYGFGVYIVAALFGFIDFSITGLLANARCLYASWSFVTGYILLYMCSPVLNSFIDNNNNRTILLTTFILFISENFITRGSGILSFWVPYLVGRFINKTNLVYSYKVNDIKAYWMLTFFIWIIVLLLYKLGVCTTAEQMCSNPLGYSYSSPFVILQAVFLFLVFVRKEFHSHIINWCSASCFAIFLIHMHPAINQMGYYSFTESLYDRPLFEHIGVLFILVVAVFLGSIVIDKIRIIVSDLIYKLLCRIKIILPKKLFIVETYMTNPIKDLIK